MIPQIAIQKREDPEFDMDFAIYTINRKNGEKAVVIYHIPSDNCVALSEDAVSFPNVYASFNYLKRNAVVDD